MRKALRLEVNHLAEKPSPEERDELLQCLLIAAPRGGEATSRVVSAHLHGAVRGQLQ